MDAQFFEYLNSNHLEQDDLYLSSWFCGKDNVPKTVCHLDTFIRFTQELSCDELHDFLDVYSWAVFDKIMEASAAVKDIDDISSFEIAITLLTDGNCTHREIYMMFMSKLSTTISFPSFNLLIPLAEYAMTNLSADFIISGVGRLISTLKNIYYSNECLVEEHELSWWLPESEKTYDLSLFGRITQNSSHQCLGRKWHRSADISVRNCLVFLRKLLVRASSHRSSSCRSRAENCSKIPCAMELEDSLVHALLELTAFVGENCDCIDIRDLVFSISLDAIFTNTSISLEYLLNHERRVRHLVMHAKMLSMRFPDTKSGEVPPPSPSEIDKSWSSVSIESCSIDEAVRQDVVGRVEEAVERVVPWHILSDELREESLQICYSAEPHAHGDGDRDSETRNVCLRGLTARLRISRSFVVMTWNLFGIACLKRAFMNHSYKISGFFTQSLYPTIYSSDYIWDNMFPSCYILLKKWTSDGIDLWNKLAATSKYFDKNLPPFLFRSSLLYFSWEGEKECYDTLGMLPLITGLYKRDSRSKRIEFLASMTASHDIFYLAQLLVNALVVVDKERLFIESCRSLRILFTELMTGHSAVILLRKLIDTCPYHQATAILVDNLRQISARTIVVKEQNILAPLNGIRAPMTPQILEERPPHISEDDILRQYHRELDCYVEFSFVVSHSKCQDMALLMIDMFVLPSIQRAISKTSFHEVLDDLDWLAASVTLLKVVLLRVAYYGRDQLNKLLTSPVLGEILHKSKSLIEKLRHGRENIQKDRAGNTKTLIISSCTIDHHDQDANTRFGSMMLKIEVLLMNITDAVSIVS